MVSQSKYAIKKGKKANIDEAISYLKKAIELNNDYAEEANIDTDFDAIRKDLRFIELINTT